MPHCGMAFAAEESENVIRPDENCDVMLIKIVLYSSIRRRILI